MSYTVNWYVQDRVVVNVITGEYTIEQMREGNDKIIAMMRAGIKPVHLLVDTRKLTNFPSIFRPLLKEIEQFRHESNMGWGVMMSSSPVLNFFGALSSNLTKQPFRSVKSYAEANEVFARVDPSLVSLLPPAAP